MSWRSDRAGLRARDTAAILWRNEWKYLFVEHPREESREHIDWPQRYRHAIAGHAEPQQHRFRISRQDHRDVGLPHEREAPQAGGTQEGRL